MLSFMNKKEKEQKLKAFHSLKENQIKQFFSNKLQTASQTMDRMNKFSRTFISLNSLAALVQKRKVKTLAKNFSQWKSQKPRSDPGLEKKLQE